MKLTQFTQSWHIMRSENLVSRLTILALTGAILLLGAIALNQKTVVVLSPPTLNEEAEVLSDQASESYKKAWSHHVAKLIGNVSTENSDFVLESLKPLLAPRIYEETLVAVNKQLDQLKRDGVSFSFEPRRIIHDKDTGRSYVTGLRFTHKGTDDADRNVQTYEMIWDFQDYRPLLDYIETYSDSPRYPEESD